MDDNSGAVQSYLFRGTDEEVAAQMRAQLGDERADEYLRTQRLRREHRPLDPGERAALDSLLAPVLADLRATGAIVPVVHYNAWEDQGPDYVYAYIGPPGKGASLGVWVNRARSVAEEVARLADHVQEWEVEELAAEGRAATWPQCPEHPNSHPLDAAADPDGTAVWHCPKSGRVAIPIGQLGAPAP